MTKAALYNEPGGPEVLQLSSVPEPVPGRGEVVLRVRAAGNVTVMQLGDLEDLPRAMRKAME